jgi:hypothetical protein
VDETVYDEAYMLFVNTERMAAMQSDTDLRAAWEAYWDAHYADDRRARRLRAVATDYPVKRGVVVSYSDLLEAGVSERALRTRPDRTLGTGVETFGSFVRDLDLDPDEVWDRSFDVLILHVDDLPGGFKPFDSNLMAHLNELVQLEVTFGGAPERISDLMEAAFVCTTGHVTRIHQPGRRRRDIAHCPDCGDPVYLEERESLFAEIRRVPVSGEGFDRLTAILGGRRWKGLSIGEGDTATINAIPRADFREDSTHGSAYLDVLHVEVDEDLPF